MSVCVIIVAWCIRTCISQICIKWSLTLLLAIHSIALLLYWFFKLSQWLSHRSYQRIRLISWAIILNCFILKNIWWRNHLSLRRLTFTNQGHMIIFIIRINSYLEWRFIFKYWSQIWQVLLVIFWSFRSILLGYLRTLISE